MSNNNNNMTNMNLNMTNMNNMNNTFQQQNKQTRSYKLELQLDELDINKAYLMNLISKA